MCRTSTRVPSQKLGRNMSDEPSKKNTIRNWAFQAIRSQLSEKLQGCACPYECPYWFEEQLDKMLARWGIEPGIVVSFDEYCELGIAPQKTDYQNERGSFIRSLTLVSARSPLMTSG